MTDTARPLPPFIPELRAAIREGRKTQTRRVIKEPIPDGFRPTQYGKLTDTIWGAFFSEPTQKPDRFVPCRYGESGQVRYLREPIYKGDDGYAYYKDDNYPVQDISLGLIPWRWKVNTLSGLFMPAGYARTFVRMIRIHAERVKEINEADAQAEGVFTPLSEIRPGHDARTAFYFLWDKINAHRGYSWNANPWAWVLTFERINS